MGQQVMRPIRGQDDFVMSVMLIKLLYELLSALHEQQFGDVSPSSQTLALILFVVETLFFVDNFIYFAGHLVVPQVK